ncbi:MAG: FMN-binding protein [Halioglobus sp.]|nr:FMN-binding protein [Halioglobus sp.]
MSRPEIIASDATPRPAWQMYRAMVGTGIFCALLIVAVFLYTLPVIERNRAAALEKAVLEVLPGATRFRRYDLEQPVYAAFDAGGELAGIALEAQRMGYQDTIRILYGYDPARQAVVGMQVLESRETPGLGDKIEKDPVFVDNFTALDVRLAADGTQLANPIVLVKPGQKTRPWQIDAISGATISSQAIADMLRDSTVRWVPLLWGMRSEFSADEEAGDER